jgi:hypothetical protein
MMTEEFDGEHILPDDYPVHAGFWYIVNGKPVNSNVSGTVKDLRSNLKLEFYYEIRRCNVIKRKLPMW